MSASTDDNSQTEPVDALFGEPSPTSVSVVIGSVRGHTLGRTLAAIQRQDLSTWELTVVAQGEGSDVRAVVDNFASRDHRIRLLHSDEFGQSVARNLGV